MGPDEEGAFDGHAVLRWVHTHTQLRTHAGARTHTHITRTHAHTRAMGVEEGYSIKLHRYTAVYVQGEDGAIHDIYRGSPKGKGVQCVCAYPSSCTRPSATQRPCSGVCVRVCACRSHDVSPADPRQRMPLQHRASGVCDVIHPTRLHLTCPCLRRFGCLECVRICDVL